MGLEREEEGDAAGPGLASAMTYDKKSHFRCTLRGGSPRLLNYVFPKLPRGHAHSCVPRHREGLTVIKARSRSPRATIVRSTFNPSRQPKKASCLRNCLANCFVWLLPRDVNPRERPRPPVNGPRDIYATRCATSLIRIGDPPRARAAAFLRLSPLYESIKSEPRRAAVTLN